MIDVPYPSQHQTQQNIYNYTFYVVYFLNIFLFFKYELLVVVVHVDRNLYAIA